MKKLIDWFKKLFGKAPEPVVVVVPEPPKAQPIPGLPVEVLKSAKTLSEKYVGVEASGEYKRHCVLAEMIKEFPEYRKGVLCLAIELAMWGDNGELL